MRSIPLLIITNFLVIVVLSFAASFIAPMLGLTFGGGQKTTLLIFCAILGFGGAFFSLAISKYMAKKFFGLKMITKPSGKREEFIFSTVQSMAEREGITMPEVAIFDNSSPNAFATGMSKNNSLVAFSTGLLDNLSQDEVEAVIGHEISHISNGDMVTMALLQGVLNTFVYFLARLIGGMIDSRLNQGRGGRGIGYYMTVFVLEIIFGILASIVLLWFSRRREFRADEGGAKLSSIRSMSNALLAIQRSVSAERPEAAVLPSKTMANFGINGNTWSKIFSSHPPIEERVAYLQTLEGTL